jgi:uncharacterized HAD superfamily protein
MNWLRRLRVRRLRRKKLAEMELYQSFTEKNEYGEAFKHILIAQLIALEIEKLTGEHEFLWETSG